ncbi:MAG: hypothetical protein ACK41P_08490, partial [Asticcacaulis sp.]
FDVLGGRFLDKPMALPSDTGVDLTLDTSVNFDDLLKDLEAFNARR